MIKSSVIITGEASETDSDDDINQKISNKAPAAVHVQGAVITGEDSESDEEHPGSISSAVSVLTDSNVPEKVVQRSRKSESLLHRKLFEANNNLYTNIETFTQNVIDQAGKDLASIDQQLLKSQITLQNAVTSLKSLNLNSTLIKDRLNSILTSKFISGIKTESS